MLHTIHNRYTLQGQQGKRLYNLDGFVCSDSCCDEHHVLCSDKCGHGESQDFLTMQVRAEPAAEVKART